jgi:hypothetical protein
MRRLIRLTAVLASFTAFTPTAQSQQSGAAHPDAASHTEARSQIEAMTPHPASEADHSAAASGVTAKPRDPYGVSSGKQLANRQKLARFRTQHNDSTAAKNTDDPYQYDGWSSQQIYTSPESVDSSTVRR